ncbi:hypothetical protein D920_01901, partial [Enterococcus faecalis 13-SD-W-01]
ITSNAKAIKIPILVFHCFIKDIPFYRKSTIGVEKQETERRLVVKPVFFFMEMR